MTDKAYYEGDILDMELDVMNVSEHGYLLEKCLDDLVEFELVYQSNDSD